MERLVRTVREATSFNEIVDKVMAETDRQRKEAEIASQANNRNREGLEARLAKVTWEIDGLVNVIAQHEHSDALLQALGVREAERKQIGQLLDECTRVAAEPLERSEVEDMLSSALEELADILLADPAICRKEIRKRIDRLVLTPSTFEGQPAYILSGDIQLLQRDNPKMLGCNGSITAEHFWHRLSGMLLKLDSRGKVLRIVWDDLTKSPPAHDEVMRSMSPDGGQVSHQSSPAQVLHT